MLLRIFQAALEIWTQIGVCPARITTCFAKRQVFVRVSQGRHASNEFNERLYQQAARSKESVREVCLDSKQPTDLYVAKMYWSKIAVATFSSKLVKDALLTHQPFLSSQLRVYLANKFYSFSSNFVNISALHFVKSIIAHPVLNNSFVTRCLKQD